MQETDDDDVSFVGDFDDVMRSKEASYHAPSLSEETSLVSPTDIGGNEFNSSSSLSSSRAAADMTVVVVVVVVVVVAVVVLYQKK